MDHKINCCMKTKVLMLLSAMFLISLELYAGSKEPSLNVTLLGTSASPGIDIDHFQTSVLVEGGKQTLLFDAGRGATLRLAQLEKFKRIRTIFLTHLHSDQVLDLPSIWLTGNRKKTVYGPSGTQAMCEYLRKAFDFDIRVRCEEMGRDPNQVRLQSIEIGEGLVYSKNGLTVKAFTVDHGPIIKPVLGYRIDYHDHSVVLSGDTRYCPNLIKHSKDVDVLIHEVAYLDPERLAKYRTSRIIQDHHIHPTQAGKLFSVVKPELAVYYHIVKGKNFSDEDLIKATQKTYGGKIIVGYDLMSICIGDKISWKKIDI